MIIQSNLRTSQIYAICFLNIADIKNMQIFSNPPSAAIAIARTFAKSNVAGDRLQYSHFLQRDSHLSVNDGETYQRKTLLLGNLFRNEIQMGQIQLKSFALFV